MPSLLIKSTSSSQQFFTSLANWFGWLPKVVSYVWIFLTSLMGVAAYLLYGQAGGHVREVRMVYYLILFTWLYPLYSFFFHPVGGLIGNLAYLAYLCYILWYIVRKDLRAAALLFPTVIWVAVATVYVVAKLLARQ